MRLRAVKAAKGELPQIKAGEKRKNDMRVRDAMTHGIIGVRDTASLAEAVETMLRAGISALCVFDERKALVGILSEGDLLRRGELGTEKRRPRWLESLLSGGRLAHAYAHEHGRTAADQASETSRKTFEEGTFAGALPSVEISRAELEKGLGVLTAFAEKTGLVSSNGDARRQVKAGGLKVNDETVSDEKMMLTAKDLTADGVIKLSLGKKKHVLIKAV